MLYLIKSASEYVDFIPLIFRKIQIYTEKHVIHFHFCLTICISVSMWQAMLCLQLLAPWLITRSVCSSVTTTQNCEDDWHLQMSSASCSLQKYKSPELLALPLHDYISSKTTALLWVTWELCPWITTQRYISKKQWLKKNHPELYKRSMLSGPLMWNILTCGREYITFVLLYILYPWNK